MRRNGLLLASLAMFAIAADKPKIDPALHGTWTVVSAEADGGAVQKPDPNKPFKFIISADKLVIHSDGTSEEAAITIDSSKKPIALDLKTSKDTKTAVGIIEVDGDTLRYCFSVAKEPVRPTEFSAKKDSDRVLLVFKREKK